MGYITWLWVTLDASSDKWRRAAWEQSERLRTGNEHMEVDCATCNVARYGSEDRVLNWQCWPSVRVSSTTRQQLHSVLVELCSLSESAVHLGRYRAGSTVPNGWHVEDICLVLDDAHTVTREDSSRFENFRAILATRISAMPRYTFELSAFPSITHGVTVCVCWKEIRGGSGALTKSAAGRQ